MARQVHQTELVEAIFNHTCGNSSHNTSDTDCIASVGIPCNVNDCPCCASWMGIVERLVDVINHMTNVAATLVAENNTKYDTVQMLQAIEAVLESDNKKLKKANKKLNAENNHIRTVPSNDRKSTGKPGRKPGCKPTISKVPEHIDREETVDVTVCPNQKDGEAHTLSEGVTDSYYRYGKVLHITVEIVRYKINRRWCRTCKKQVSAEPPCMHKYERVSSNVSAVATGLNLDGLSFGKVAEYCDDALKQDISRSWAYRTKIRAGRRMAPEYRTIKQDILSEPYLACDEMWWKVPGSNGAKIMVARGAEHCLAKVVSSANIDEVGKMLPGYTGVVGQDSNTIWLHTGGDHQMCMQHQRRLSKKCMEHRNLKGDSLEFLTELHRLDYKHYMYDKIEDIHTRRVAARCLDKERSELMWGTYEDDEYNTIARRQKRHYREGYYMSTHLYNKDVSVDNNGVERVNRRFVSVRNDGGGNRSQKGMDANSVLFTLKATDWINKRSFFDHLVRSASGDG